MGLDTSRAGLERRVEGGEVCPCLREGRWGAPSYLSWMAQLDSCWLLAALTGSWLGQGQHQGSSGQLAGSLSGLHNSENNKY